MIPIPTAAPPGKVWRSAALITALLFSAANATVSPLGAGSHDDVRVAPQLPHPAVPLEAFFADPEFSDPQLSPDGRKLAVLHKTRDGAARNLRVIDLATLEARALTDYDDHQVAWFVWINGGRIAYRAEPLDAETRFSSEWFNLVDFSTKRTYVRRHGSRQRGWSRSRHTDAQARWRSLRLLDPRPIDAAHLLVTIDAQPNADPDSAGSAYPDVASVNVKTGAIRLLARNPGDVYHWLVDRKGTARIAVSLDDRLRSTIRHRAGKREPWQEIASFEYGEAGIWPLAFTTEPHTIYVLSDIGRDTRALYTFDLRTGTLGDRLFAHSTVDVSGLVLSRDGEWAIGARYETDRQRIYYFDPYRQAIDTELADALAGYEVDVQFSEDSQTALVTAHNEKNPGRFYQFDADSGQLRELFSKREFLPEQYLSPTQPIDFEARDGERLHGFVTVPRGADSAAPMVVIVHGGPHEVRDRWGFDPEVQFLANRGYAVLQVNFRGSSGYGRRFEQLGWGHWGERIQDDIADAVRWAVDNGYGDPGRVCIYGSSFGGYSALMNMARNPGLYRCGVSFGGVTDLSMLVAEQSPVEPGRMSFLDLVVGPASDQASLALSSPINLIDAIDAPVLLAHGLRDNVVPVSHFERFVKALTIYDKPGEGLLLEDQGHGLEDEDARYLFYRTLEDFLYRHLAQAPGSASPPARPVTGSERRELWPRG